MATCPCLTKWLQNNPLLNDTALETFFYSLTAEIHCETSYEILVLKQAPNVVWRLIPVTVCPLVLPDVKLRNFQILQRATIEICRSPKSRQTSVIQTKTCNYPFTAVGKVSKQAKQICKHVKKCFPINKMYNNFLLRQVTVARNYI